MLPIAIAISLTHKSFGAVVLTFDKTIGNAGGEKLEKGENFLSPVFECRERFAQMLRSQRLNFLDVWIEKVQTLGPEHLRKTLSAFKNWRQEILAFFQFLPTRISNGFVEGKNNRTKALMRQGYGYRNRQHLRLRILLGKVSTHSEARASKVKKAPRRKGLSKELSHS